MKEKCETSCIYFTNITPRNQGQYLRYIETVVLYIYLDIYY